MDESKFNKLLKVMKQIATPSAEDGTFVRSVEWIEKIATDCLADVSEGLVESNLPVSMYNTTPVYDASLFSWIGNSGIADCSDLGVKVGDLPFKPFDFDTKHSGLILHNPKKGTSKLFYLVKTFTYSDDPEVSSWLSWTEQTGWTLRDIDNKIEIIIVNS